MTEKQSIKDVLREIRRNDPSCRSDSEALTVVGLLSFAAALSQFEDMRRAIVLKGGTVLRMLEKGKLNRAPTKDLDASLLGEIVNFSDRVETEVVDACNELLDQQFVESLDFSARYREAKYERRPEDTEMYEFRLELRAQISRPDKMILANENRFKFEASADERVDESLLIDFQQTVLPMPIRLKCYAPLQSLAEKLRAILQKRRYHEINEKDGKSPSGGNFPPRHVLDIETLYGHCIHEMHLLPALFKEKCAVKKIPQNMITREYFDHEILWKQVRVQCAEFDRNFESCQSVYWKCVEAVLV